MLLPILIFTFLFFVAVWLRYFPPRQRDDDDDLSGFAPR